MCFDIRHEDAGFGVCPARFQSCFNPVFPYYAPFPTFLDNIVYSMPLNIGSICFVFDFDFVWGCS